MELPYVVNAPREISLGGQLLRARTLTLADLGEVLAWLEDRLPPDPERDGPVLFSAEASRVALASTEGLAVVLHLSLLPCQPGLTRDDARRLAAGMTPEDEGRLMSVAFRRRPQYGRGDDSPKGHDLAEIRWGQVVEALAQGKAANYAAVLGMTLDQYDNHVARGELPDRDTLDPSEVQRMWEEAMGQKGEDKPEALP